MCSSGFVLFKNARLNRHGGALDRSTRISVIIPARNEAKNLPYLLSSLNAQTCRPYETILVDDCSEDRTGEIAKEYGATVIRNDELPDGWTGKTWAVWNGYLKSAGDILVFLDADVRLAPRALEVLVKARERSKGVISVVPFHYTEKFYERLSLLPCLLGAFAFTSPFERKRRQKGLYGSCIVVAREDYERIRGHKSIRSELLDDLNLGQEFSREGIHVENYLGNDLVSFRMYPNGIVSELQGFGKGAVLSTATLCPATVVMIAFWVIGLLATGIAAPIFLIFRHPWAMYFLAGYLLYALQIAFFLKYIGRYGIVMPVLHILSSLFFIVVMAYSFYQVAFVGSISWKGRQIRIGGRKNS